MIVDPHKIVEMGVVRLAERSKIQQNGIDITIRSLKEIVGCSGSNMAKYCDCDLKTSIVLKPGAAYDFTCNEYVDVPNDMAAIIIMRSTFNRLGAFITTGLYDAGFKNYIGGVIHTTIPFILEPNMRIAQIVFMRSEGIAQYNGQYQDRPTSP